MGKGNHSLYVVLYSRYQDDHRLCCHFDDLQECVSLEPQPPLFSCGSLMQNTVLRVFMWILGFSALFGNIFVIVWRQREKTGSQTQAVHSFFVFNLAISDLFMGFYMLIIAAVDIYYGDKYFIESDLWRASNLCRFAGFISVLSSEASVFFITLISIDRFICIVYPFSQAKLTYKSSHIVVCILWVISLIISLIPTIFAGPESDVYDLSDVCIGLPLITRPTSFSTSDGIDATSLINGTFIAPTASDTKPAWYYSIALFLGVNLICFVVILGCYIAIFESIRRSSRRVGRKPKDDERKMAIKMAVIVGSDFVCWMPVIIMGILSQTGLATIPIEMYVWIVVFILPINSSLNPYLYSVSSLIGNRLKTTSSSIGSKSDTLNPKAKQSETKLM